MHLAIIGLPASGKTTVFNALTRGHVQPAVHTSGKFEVHSGVADLPDERLAAVAKILRPRKVTYAKLQYDDIAGVARGGRHKDGLEPALLNVLSQSDGLILVVRAFQDERVSHPDGTVSPERDTAAVQAELLLSDIVTIERRLERIQEAAKRGVPPQEKDTRAHESELLARLKAMLESERPLRALPLGEDSARAVRGFGLLTLKPLLVVYNLGDEQPLPPLPADRPAEHELYTFLRGRLEMELAQMAPTEAAEFSNAYGIDEPALRRFGRLACQLLGRITFFTCNEAEARAWTIREGSTAHEAAGLIHSDMARGFIRAEVVSYTDLMAADAIAETRRRGTLRQEGKAYAVQDGDLIQIKFNV